MYCLYKMNFIVGFFLFQIHKSVYQYMYSVYQTEALLFKNIFKIY